MFSKHQLNNYGHYSYRVKIAWIFILFFIKTFAQVLASTITYGSEFHSVVRHCEKVFGEFSIFQFNFTHPHRVLSVRERRSSMLLCKHFLRQAIPVFSACLHKTVYLPSYLSCRHSDTVKGARRHFSLSFGTNMSSTKCKYIIYNSLL